MERGSIPRSSLKGRERAIVNRTNIGTASKATLGNVLWGWGGGGEGGVRGEITYGLFERIDCILN